MKLKRKKIGDRNYALINVSTGEYVANAAQTGEHGRDNYPWSWHLLGERIFGRLAASTGKSEDSLKNCVDWVESEATSSGIYKPAGSVSGYDVKEGQVFRYASYYYRALADAHGEFNAYIPASNHRGDTTEIIVRHGDSVTLYELESY